MDSAQNIFSKIDLGIKDRAFEIVLHAEQFKLGIESKRTAEYRENQKRALKYLEYIKDNACWFDADCVKAGLSSCSILPRISLLHETLCLNEVDFDLDLLVAESEYLAETLDREITQKFGPKVWTKDIYNREE